MVLDVTRVTTPHPHAIMWYWQDFYRRKRRKEKKEDKKRSRRHEKKTKNIISSTALVDQIKDNWGSTANGRARITRSRTSRIYPNANLEPGVNDDRQNEGTAGMY